MKLNWANTIGIVACMLLFLFIGMVLFTPCERIPATLSNCQSNMKQIGRAFKMYLGDWDEHYPTNRAWSKTKGELGVIENRVELTPAGLTDTMETCARFKYGVNWVEGLYDYIEVASDTQSVWCCPVVSKKAYPKNSTIACTSYVFNRNLVEKSEDIVKNATHLMLVREVDRLVNADLRPINDSTGSPDKPPICPFLNGSDVRMGKTHDQLHRKGSIILFADGHIILFDTSYMLNKPQWDPETKQWCNFLDSKDYGIYKNIAITP